VFVVPADFVLLLVLLPVPVAVGIGRIYNLPFVCSLDDAWAVAVLVPRLYVRSFGPFFGRENYHWRFP